MFKLRDLVFLLSNFKENIWRFYAYLGPGSGGGGPTGSSFSITSSSDSPCLIRSRCLAFKAHLLRINREFSVRSCSIDTAYSK